MVSCLVGAIAKTNPPEITARRAEGAESWMGGDRSRIVTALYNYMYHIESKRGRGGERQRVDKREIIVYKGEVDMATTSDNDNTVVSTILFTMEYILSYILTISLEELLS